MTDYIHIMPKSGDHNDRQGPAGCYCEPECRRLRSTPLVRVVIHQGINDDDLRMELAAVFESFPDKELR